jgi:RNA polymerase sigma-70 factor, ECF subfamily
MKRTSVGTEVVVVGTARDVRTHQAVHHVLAGLGIRGQDLDDLQQDVLVAILEAENRFRGEAAIGTWVYAICRNLASKYRRRSLLDLTLEDPFHQAPGLGQASSPAEAEEQTDWVRRVVASLSTRNRTALQLLDLESRPYEEAARQLGLSVPATRVLRHRARCEFRLKAEKDIESHLSSIARRPSSPRDSKR